MSAAVIQERWSSRSLVGDYKHACIVRLRPGYMRRGYLDENRIDTGAPIFPPLIWKGQNHSCWKGVWTPTGPWQALPNIANAKWARSFDVQSGGPKGTTTGTVVMDNISFPEEEGVAGLYHAIARGYFSPSRGVRVRGRPSYWPDDAANEWRNALNAGWQLEVWEGYGQGADIELKATLDPVTHSYAPDSGALDRTFTGIVLDCETESHPDKITITAQDFGIFLTDQRPLGQNKDPAIHTPLTFADRRRTQGEQTITGGYNRSDGVVDAEGAWTSGVHDVSGNAWIELTLPSGFYEDFFVAPEWSGMRMHVSVFMGPGGGSLGVHAVPPGWVTIPGEGGVIDGISYLYRATPAESPTRRWSIQPPMALDWQGATVPNGSKLRLTFANLHATPEGYQAGTHKFVAFRFGSDPSNPPAGTAKTTAKGWILVQDAAEVVRMIFIWAGFQEWRVENFGWSLFQPLVYGADKYFIDIITDMLQQGSFIFYMGQPTNDDRSIGVPHFEHIHAIDGPQRSMIEVRDTDTAEALNVTWTLDNLPYVMRYLGAITKTGGHQLFGFGIEGLTRRYMATYHPPWSGNWRGLDPATADSTANLGVRRIAGVLRQFTETMGTSFYTQLRSDEECLFACVLAAIQYALGMCTGKLQIPGLSGLDLNRQISVAERASAVNSRMWLASVESDHVMGGADEPGHWTISLGGAMVDTQEMVALVADYNYAWKANQRNKASFV